MQFLRAKDHKLVPWKNGGGVTREIAVYVDGTVHADFLWRVSIATVDRDGPFSRFEGIDRTIAVLQGAGMILKSGDDEARLTPESQPFAFRGETPIDASVIDGETTDLNAMTRRGYFNHHMERLLLTEQATIEGNCDETIVIFNGSLTAESIEFRQSGHSLDAVLGIGRGERVDLVAEGPAEVLVIRLSRSA